jgi:hypothetical protein
MIPLTTTRVTGAAPFSPAMIAGLVSWWEASKTSGSPTDGTAVTPTQLVAGGPTISCAAGEQPLFKTNIVNGNPALLFDGVNDKIDYSSFTCGWVVIAAKYTLATFNDYDGLWTGQAGTAGNIYFVGDGGGGLTNWFPTDRATVTLYKDNVATTSNVTNAWHVFTATDSSPQTAAMRMGADRNNGRPIDAYVLGKASGSGTLSAADQKRLEQYFGRFIGVTI